MSGPMYFKPTPEQVARSLASTCGLATPKDPTDCGGHCDHYKQAGGPCQFHRPSVIGKMAEEAYRARLLDPCKLTPDLDKAIDDYLALPKVT